MSDERSRPVGYHSRLMPVVRISAALVLTWMVAGPPPADPAQGSPTTYRVTRQTGDHAFLFEFRSAAKPIMTPPVNDALSTWQALPFPWKFFGAAVDGYAASDNGYLTFDKTTKASAAMSTALTDAAAPRNSLFAFWTDMRLEAGHGQWVGHVYSATLGAAPNRVHAIYWMGPIAAGEAFERSSYNFLVAIYETGEFEVIFASGRKGAPVKATVGARNADGSIAVIAEAHGFDYPPVGYGGDDDVTYRFIPAVR
jgi:hypothetical protein